MSKMILYHKFVFISLGLYETLEIYYFERYSSYYKNWNNANFTKYIREKNDTES